MLPVHRLPRPVEPRRRRADVDHRGALGAPQRRQGSLHEQQRGANVDCVLPIELLDRHVLERGQAHRAGVVDDHVDSPQRSECLGGHRRWSIPLGKVGWDRMGDAAGRADLAGDSLELLGRPSDERDGHARSAKRRATAAPIQEPAPVTAATRVVSAFLDTRRGRYLLEAL